MLHCKLHKPVFLGELIDEYHCLANGEVLYSRTDSPNPPFAVSPSSSGLCADNDDLKIPALTGHIGEANRQ